MSDVTRALLAVLVPMGTRIDAARIAVEEAGGTLIADTVTRPEAAVKWSVMRDDVEQLQRHYGELLDLLLDGEAQP
jgi:hypothetical protein